MDGQPIRLKYGESETFSPGGGITGVEITKISAKAKNIAFTTSWVEGEIYVKNLSSASPPIAGQPFRIPMRRSAASSP
jgi:hypothetical protein